MDRQTGGEADWPGRGALYDLAGCLRFYSRLPVPQLPGEPDPLGGNMPGMPIDALQRLTDRQNASGEAGNSRSEGFEASIHRIK